MATQSLKMSKWFNGVAFTFGADVIVSADNTISFEFSYNKYKPGKLIHKFYDDANEVQNIAQYYRFNDNNFKIKFSHYYA